MNIAIIIRGFFVTLSVLASSQLAAGAGRAVPKHELRHLAGAPYPASNLIGGLRVDWSTHFRGAPGSDNFMMTWADDDHQCGIWGDGGGFKGDNQKYRGMDASGWNLSLNFTGGGRGKDNDSFNTVRVQLLPAGARRDDTKK